jgi:protein-S-isoprenylcysteine O-methyltransferase Ste14
MKNNFSDEIPLSATRQYVAYSGVGAILIAFVALRCLPLTAFSDWANAFVVLTFFATTILSLEIFVQRVYLREGSGLNFAVSNSSIKRTATKLLGLCASVAFIGSLYWLFPEYHGEFYKTYFAAIKFFLPVWLLVSIPYFYFIDKYMVDPYDGYWYCGAAITLNFNAVNFNKLCQHLLGWIVKGFFLPLMFTYLCQDINNLLKVNIYDIHSYKSFYGLGIDCLYFMDVAIAVAGYVFSLRLIDTHVRSCEPTVKGWIVALICYQPFYSVFGDFYVAYSLETNWSDWLSPYPLLYWTWGACIIFLVFIYAWATAMFGLRFSNLTNRGIITAGPYKWTKHPAYLSKNLSWWMISMPFLSVDGYLDALRHSLMLCCLNYCYYLRAKTEESHLSSDQSYVEYSDWIINYGLFSKLRFFKL